MILGRFTLQIKATLLSLCVCAAVRLEDLSCHFQILGDTFLGSIVITPFCWGFSYGVSSGAVDYEYAISRENCVGISFGPFHLFYKDWQDDL
jgi:hypothetical protein